MKQHIHIDKLTPNQGILDFSHLLDAPAGKHGFVQARNGHLFFEDGQRVRFLGFNIATRSNTPDHATAEKLAQRFASSAESRLSPQPESAGSSSRHSSGHSRLISFLVMNPPSLPVQSVGRSRPACPLPPHSMPPGGRI